VLRATEATPLWRDLVLPPGADDYTDALPKNKRDLSVLIMADRSVF
jgi:hypothetical protein